MLRLVVGGIAFTREVEALRLEKITENFIVITVVFREHAEGTVFVQNEEVDVGLAECYGLWTGSNFGIGRFDRGRRRCSGSGRKCFCKGHALTNGHKRYDHIKNNSHGKKYE